jgi:hypothetical protein
MTAALSSSMGVIHEIDRELNRLEKCERVLASERQLLLSARAALAGEAAMGRARRRRLSQHDIAAYLAEHPGATAAQIAETLHVPATNVSTHLYRGRHTRYERREDGGYLR